MKQQEVLKKIGVIITEITDQYKYLSTGEEALNDLELELFVANANFLTEHAEILRKVNAQLSHTATPPARDAIQLPKAAPLQPPPVPTPETEKPVLSERFFEPVVQHVKPEVDKVNPADIKLEINDEPPASTGIDLGGEDSEEEFSFIRKSEPETIRHELIIDEADLWDEDEDELPEPETPKPLPEVKYNGIKTSPVDDTPVNPEPVIAQTPPPAAVPVRPAPETIAVEKPVIVEKPVVAETPVAAPEKPVAMPERPALTHRPEPVVSHDEEKPLTINQRMSAMQQQNRVHEQTVGAPIADLKSAISLNDKLLYVKDLFNGYSLAYSEAIDILNRYKTYDEAEAFLKNNYATKNNWDAKPATTEKFYALLRRRFA